MPEEYTAEKLLAFLESAKWICDAATHGKFNTAALDVVSGIVKQHFKVTLPVKANETD